MSWQTDDGKHEGWPAAEFLDGRFAVGSGDGGALVRFVGPDLDADDVLANDLGRGVVDGRTAIGWRALCECGWRGLLWAKVTGPARRTPGTHEAYDAEPSIYGDAPGGLEDVIYQEWLGHLPPASSTYIDTTATGLIDDARRHIEACGKILANLADALTGANATKARSALGDTAAAHDALAHLRDWITDPKRDKPF